VSFLWRTPRSVRLNITMDDDVYERLKKKCLPKSSVPLFQEPFRRSFIRIPRRWMAPIGLRARSSGEEALLTIGNTLIKDGSREADC